MKNDNPDELAPPRSHVFDGKRSMQGYRINSLAQSMRHPENRQAFIADETGYMTRMGLTEEEQDLVRKRDWYGMQTIGGNLLLVHLPEPIAGVLGSIGREYPLNRTRQFIRQSLGNPNRTVFAGPASIRFFIPFTDNHDLAV